MSRVARAGWPLSSTGALTLIWIFGSTVVVKLVSSNCVERDDCGESAAYTADRASRAMRMAAAFTLNFGSNI